eukprot:gene13-12823_t
MYDVCVVGAGPAGMFLAAELAKRGLSVSIIGRDLPFTNNYGVWMDEYEALGMTHTIECSFKDTLCYFGEGKEAVGDNIVMRSRLIQPPVRGCRVEESLKI